MRTATSPCACPTATCRSGRSCCDHPAHEHPRMSRYAGDGFRAPPKKSLGQHFLHERGVVDRIIHAVDPKPGDRLVEIGPGQGAMTFPLLERHGALTARSEEHTSELQSLMRISYAVFCLKNNIQQKQ